MKDPKKQYRNRFIAALVGTGVVALCCFTPILVVSLGVVGLSAMTPYLDYVLLPALVIFNPRCRPCVSKVAKLAKIENHIHAERNFL